MGAWSGALIAVGALLLGGATALWAQAIVALALGLLLIAFPPRRSLGTLPAFLVVILALIACTAFLPDHWLGLPVWKKHLVDELGIASGPTRTPQPVLTAEAAGLFALGMLWTYWALAFDWGRRLRVRICRGVVTGVAILAAIAVYCFYSGAKFPLWEQAANRGFFPNRNQMADVLVLCGILNYALLHEGLRQRKWWDLMWLLPLAAISAGLVVSYSRAGIILGFTGIVLWHLGSFFRRRSIEKAAVSLSALVVAGALFFLFGSTTLERFAGPVNGGEASQSMLKDFRVVIQQDALRFTGQSPWLGVGLGNFSPLFAMERQRSAMPNMTLHPESDWLWAASELGWPAVALLLLALGWWAWKCLRVPADDEEWSAVRYAAAIGVILFALHGLVDVSGHRLGSAMFAMLLAGLAMPLQELPRTRWAPWAVRVLGLLPLLLGTWWTQSTQGNDRWPSSATVLDHQIDLGNALDSDDFKTVLAEAAAALQIAPLQAQLYFQHGYANAVLGGDVQTTFDDFQRATELQPGWPNVFFDVGNVWLTTGYADFALKAWTEALNRAGEDSPDFFRRMIQAARDAPIMRSALREAAFQDPKLLLVSLQYATAEEASSDVARYVLTEPELEPLTEAQRFTFLTLWWQKGTRETLIAWLARHPAWNEQMWPYRAEALAQQNQFQQAWEMVAAHVKAPALPAITPTRSLSELQRDFLLHPDDFAVGYMLFLAQRATGQQNEALFTLRKLAAMPNRPAYIFWLQANLYTKRSGWPEAWSAWQQYRANTR